MEPQYMLTITAMADRDQSCNVYTYTETFDLGYGRPSAEVIKAHVEDVKDRFLGSWPHRGVNAPFTVPVDVNIIDQMSISINVEP